MERGATAECGRCDFVDTYVIMINDHWEARSEEIFSWVPSAQKSVVQLKIFKISSYDKRHFFGFSVQPPFQLRYFEILVYLTLTTLIKHVMISTRLADLF